MESKELKKKIVSLYLTDAQYKQIAEEAEKIGVSLSAYCIQALEKGLGKVSKIDPKLITIEPIDIYTDDIREGLSKVGATAAKLDRLLYSLSMKENVAEYELKRIADLTAQLKEEEKEFNNTLTNVYEERASIRKEVLKKVDKIVKKAIKGGGK